MSPDPYELSHFIRSKAVELGFSALAFARAGPLDDSAMHIREWVARGFNGSMRYLADNPRARADARNLMDGARSIVSLALNYYTEPEPADAPGFAKISRYARFRDYHKVIKKKLDLLAKAIVEHYPSVNCTGCVDTRPILEKAYAARAGLGFIGKNSCLITEDFGSFVFLSELIIDSELDYGIPAETLCGSCTKCIDACPTGAIVAPFQVDARRCISYITSEKGEQPDEALSRACGTWVFGCDICQDVCPFNTMKMKPTVEPEFVPRPKLVSPDLESLSEFIIDDSVEGFDEQQVGARERFLSAFAGTPIARAGEDKFSDNVKRAIRNNGTSGRNARNVSTACRTSSDGLEVK